MITKNNNALKKVLYSVTLSLLLCLAFWLMISYVYDNAEKNASKELHIYTKEIKDDINIQLKSDTENLFSLANIASELYTQATISGNEYSEEAYDFLFRTYVKTGLIEHIALFFPNNTLITRLGSVSLTGKLLFENEVKEFEEKGQSYYISDVVDDYTKENTKIIRDAVPVKVNNDETGEEEIVAILYGRIDIEDLYEKYTAMLPGNNSVLWIIDRDNLDFILNSANDEPNLSYIKHTSFFDNYTYREFGNDIVEGESGYTKFKRPNNNEFVYGHYSKLNHGNWQICLLMPESEVYAGANEMRRNLLTMFIIIVSIMIIYLIIITNSERKSSALHFRASQIRKQLLEVTQNPEIIPVSLASIAHHTKSKMAFFSDTDADECIFISNDKKILKLSAEAEDEFIMNLLSYSAKHREDNELSALVHKITKSKIIQMEYPSIYNTMIQYGIKSVCFATVINKKKRASIIGVTNPKNAFSACKLLKEIAICFSMSIFNRNYLHQTETIAITDSLTGLYNRMAYKKDLPFYEEINSKKLSCIYIDIDGLHMFNNKFGHNAGDGMLLYIANATKDAFDTSKIYRMGGDEYVIFSDNISKDELENRLNVLLDKVSEANYHISYGVEFSSGSTSPDVLIENAEKKMYERKAKYYQEKELNSISKTSTGKKEHIETGIKDLNEALNVMSKHYLGIYCINLEKDEARHIMSPDFLLEILESSKSFKTALTNYMNTMVNPDYHRSLMGFSNFNAIRAQIAEGHSPGITYEKISGEKIKLTVHGFSDYKDNPNETIWLFEKL